LSSFHLPLHDNLVAAARQQQWIQASYVKALEGGEVIQLQNKRTTNRTLATTGATSGQEGPYTKPANLTSP
jgi:hypothetical protein